jgi:LysM repeat protein
MKKLFIKILIASAISGMTSFYTYAQVSGTKKISGIEFYVYKVQAGEGLYSISKNFGVSQADISSLNPKAQTGLKAGDEILIPAVNKKGIVVDKQSLALVKDSIKATVAAKKKELTAPTITLVEHKVEEKETVYGICKKYGVSSADLIKYNPVLSSGLKQGMVLKVPQKK